jgi:hypothetical protein
LKNSYGRAVSWSCPQQDLEDFQFEGTLPKPLTSNAKADGRYGKQDFVYLPEEDTYRCPAGEQLPYRFTSEEDGKMLRRYWTTACQDCSLKSQCTTGPEWPAPGFVDTGLS